VDWRKLKTYKDTVDYHKKNILAGKRPVVSIQMNENTYNPYKYQVRD